VASRDLIDGEVPARLRPLHGGRHNLSPQIVAFNQRERLLAAIAEMVAEHGYNKTTIAQITDTASVSRRTFYEHFSGKESCFLAAYDAVATHIDELMIAAAKEQSQWPDQVAAALAELLRFLASRPQLARLCLVESAAAGEGMASRHEQTAQRLTAMLAAGRSFRDGERPLAEGIEEALIGGIMTLLTRRTAAGGAEQLERFTPAVVELALAPYIGYDEARRVAARHS
jgi:AcrR family transcriptional regulator